MDVKIAFLNGVVQDKIYIEQPKVFERYDQESHVCILKRELYGIKQAPRAWYTWIDIYLTGLCFTRSEVDANLSHIVVDSKFLILVLCVDDLILTGYEKLITLVKRILQGNFR